MKRKRKLPLLFIFATMLLLMSIPAVTSDKFRSAATNVSSPFWQIMVNLKSLFSKHAGSEDGNFSRENYLLLSIENQRLKKEVENAQKLIQESFLLKKRGLGEESSSGRLDPGAERYLENLQKLRLYKLEAIPAEVIYRAPTSWNSSLWINRGHSSNRELGRQIIAKNSPVIIENALVGVIDYVGESQSRVRLITDSGLTLAVRAARGDPQYQRLADSIDLITDQLTKIQDLGISAAQKKQCLQPLKALKTLLIQSKKLGLYAKGELHGSSKPLWRSKGILLKGVGFNYDYADEEGPSRDLRTGIPMDTKHGTDPITLIQKYDILVTSGMEGIFPAGLQVAEVVSIGELEEGDYAFELSATPIASRLDELTLLFILPPLGYDPNDQPDGA